MTDDNTDLSGIDTLNDLGPAEQYIVENSLKSLRRYVIYTLVLVVLMVAIGLTVVIVQNVQYHDQLTHASQATHGLLHQLQATLAQDKCEIIHGTDYPCPLPK